MTKPDRTITVPYNASVLIFTDEALEAQIYKPRSEEQPDGSHVMPGHTVVAAAVAFALKEDPHLLDSAIQALMKHIKSEGGEIEEIKLAGDEDKPHGRLH